MTTNEFIERAEAKHGKRYDYSRSIYVNARTKLEIVCRTHGPFMQTPDRHVREGCGCPKCARNVRLTKEEFVAKAKAVHGDLYDYSEVVYKDNRTPVVITCRVHGCFEQSPSNHLAGKGCAKCANNVRLTLSEFVKRAREIHGDRYEYSQAEYHGNREPVTILCKLHGPFEQIPYVHLTGCGCPACGEADRREHHDALKAHESAKKTFLAKYGVDNPMKVDVVRQKQLAAVRSEICNAKRNDTKRANNSFNTSLPEHRLFLMLCDIFGVDDVLRNYKSVEYPFNCDFYIPSRNMYIELNAHWSHGKHWYTEADKAIVDDWRTRSAYFRNAAETFSVRDVAKRIAARDAHLNYIVFWVADLTDAKQWVLAGCPDGHDWDKEYSWL